MTDFTDAEKKEASRRGKRSRNKGHSFEREIARELSTVFGQCRRGLQSRDGRDASDVICPGLGDQFWIECKRYKARPNIHAAMRQALECCKGRKAVAITRADNEEALVTMTFRDWKNLLEQLAETQEGEL